MSDAMSAPVVTPTPCSYSLLISDVLGLPKRVMTMLQQCRELDTIDIRYAHNFCRARKRLLSMLNTAKTYKDTHTHTHTHNEVTDYSNTHKEISAKRSKL